MEARLGWPPRGVMECHEQICILKGPICLLGRTVNVQGKIKEGSQEKNCVQ